MRSTIQNSLLRPVRRTDRKNSRASTGTGKCFGYTLASIAVRLSAYITSVMLICFGHSTTHA